ncbi:HD domain-containing protein [Candidatus Bathyarchaeota archaeon]|nr:HD domain-containing protein [Candidatus Bathyarchaeota archaeon]
METHTLQSALLRDLSKASLVQRLKHITLSAVPAWLGPRVATASRFQHSIAVGRLSLLVSGGTRYERLLLTAVSVLHDVGDGPFPHISDPSMKEHLGFTHENAVRFAFDSSLKEDKQILDKYGLDLDEVCSVLAGSHRLSKFFYGFPDLDNADNIYRFISSIPGKPLKEPSYLPSEIASSFSLNCETQNIDSGLKKKWAADFEKVYSYVWNDKHNMVCWTMLGRALRILSEELTPGFFRLTNREAYRLICEKLPQWAKGLRQGKYKIALDKKFVELKGDARKLACPSNLSSVEKEFCKEAGLEDWMLGLTVDQPLMKDKPDHWRVYLVLYDNSEAAVNLVNDMLSSSEPLILHVVR